MAINGDKAGKEIDQDGKIEKILGTAELDGKELDFTEFGPNSDITTMDQNQDVAW